MDTQRLCPGCQQPLAPDVPLGLCPECLVQAGFPTGPDSGPQAAFVPPTLAELAGVFPQLEILELIGKGGMGAVYKARQKQLDRVVALKILPPGAGAGAGFAERFAREARALARLNHPGIVTLFEFGQAGGLYFFLMEYVDGVNLRQLLAARRISSREALAIVPQICDALQFAHDQGIVHRDIKPENILLDRRGRVKLADFGLAKLMGVDGDTAAGLGPIGGVSTLTEAGKVMGTPNYMAPEQREHPGEVDNRADIYALGVVFYQMLTGELPGRPIEPPSRKVAVDVRLDEVVLRALETKPELRYQQASEFKTGVETVAGTPPSIRTSPLRPGGTGSPLLSRLEGGAPGVQAAPGPINPSGAPDGANLVTAPAVGLLVLGILKMVGCLILLAWYAGPMDWLSSVFSEAGLLPGRHWGALYLTSDVLLRMALGVLIIFGAVRMLKLRSYAWAMAAAILAIVSCMTCSVLGLILGLWAFVVLSKPGVRAAFGPDQPRPQPGGTGGRGAGFWILAAIGLLFLLLLLAVVGLIYVGMRHVAVPLNQADSTGDLRQEVSLSYPLTADGRFSLDNVNGPITITGWDQNEVEIKAIKHGGSQAEVDAVTIDADASADRVAIHTRHPSGERGFRWSTVWPWIRDQSHEVDYTIHVPRRANLKDIGSVNGQITISGVGGNIKATTVNGQTKVTDAAGDLKLETVNGQITAELTRLGGSQEARFNAVNGTIKVTLPADADATVSASTVNGGLTSDFPELKVVKEFPLGNHLVGTLSGGGAKVHAEAVNGTIRFELGGRGAPVSPSAPVTGEAPPAVLDAQRGKGFEYRVQADDTLSAIIQAYQDKGINVTLTEVLNANPGLTAGTALEVGKTIFIPYPPTSGRPPAPR